MNWPWYTWAWLVWIAYFLAVEGIALFNSKKGDTFSEHIWTWFAVQDWWRPQSTTWKRPIKWHHRLRRYVLLGFLAWLLVHLAFGGVWA